MKEAWALFIWDPSQTTTRHTTIQTQAKKWQKTPVFHTKKLAIQLFHLLSSTEIFKNSIWRYACQRGAWCCQWNRLAPQLILGMHRVLTCCASVPVSLLELFMCFFGLFLPVFMAEDLNGQHAHPKQPAAAWESGLLTDAAASMPGSSGSQSSSKSSRRVCSRPDCTRVLGSFLQDPHSVCVNCRDICNPGKRCECSTWSIDKVLTVYKYQCSLRRRRCAKAKHSHSSVAQPFSNVACDIGTLQSVKAPPFVQGTRDSPAASVLSNILGGSDISSQDSSVLSQDELTARDLAVSLSPPPMALGEGLAGRDTCSLALSPCPQDGIGTHGLPPLSFQPTRAQCLTTPPTAQQTHCPCRTSLHSGHVAQTDPTHTDSCHPGGDLFLADAYDRIWVPRRPQGLARHNATQERDDEISTGLEGDEGCEFLPHAPSMYYRMMNYIEDAMGQWIDLGTSTTPTKKGPILLGRAQPVRFAKIYSVAGQEVYGKAALVNPSLHTALNPSAREPRFLREHLEVARMEGMVAKSRDALNYSFWCLGAMHLLAAHNLPAHLLDLEEQLFKAVCMALNDACRDSSSIIANLRAWRREAYLGSLKPSFSQVKKGILRRSSIFTPLLFNEDRLQEVLQSSKSNADRTLHEATLRPLAQLPPVLGTPLVKRGPRPSTTMSVRPSAAPA
ncbi:hypothetical protein E2C01_042579 [Portunus trituberculatus]|uniref:Uncharacterized protein n=1 Tax=Portunus trituberculatus TaxID=210409 RepID=A0A5B7FTE5_PORTR|nr:hypothetical protein [Portunus trituberculatus]